MTLKNLHQLSILAKKIILLLIHNYFSEDSTQKLLDSQNATSLFFKINEKDLPIMRDLKACLNMLTALEKACDKWMTPYVFWSLRVIKKLEITGDVLQFYQHYKIYAATSNILSTYLKNAISYTIEEILPQLPQKLEDFLKVCSAENLEKVTNIFIEQMILLEKYQENYHKRKKMPLEQKEGINKEDFITFLVRNGEDWLKNIFKDNYPAYFPKEKSETKEQIGFYLENKKDTETIKNIKHLSNGIISIKKALLHLDNYQQAGTYSPVASLKWLTYFIQDLRSVYIFFTDFEYEAILAENASPLANKIKIFLLKLNDTLEKMACVADKLENELHLKEGILLAQVDLLMLRYQQICYELDISIDYAKQKRTYFNARINALKIHLLNINTQIIHIKYFLKCRNEAVKKINENTRKDMLRYIEKNERDICMNRINLQNYHDFLKHLEDEEENINTSVEKNKLLDLFYNSLERIGNFCGWTLHAEWMKTLETRLAYLEDQSRFIEYRLEYYLCLAEQLPFDFLHFDKTESSDINTHITHFLQKHVQDLTKDKENLLLNLQTNITEETKNTSSADASPLILNRLKLKTNELNFFHSLTKKVEENSLSEFYLPEDKDNLHPKSILIMQEISDALSNDEMKSKCFKKA